MPRSETTSLVSNISAGSNSESGKIEASAHFQTSAERIFRAISTDEICNWWVRPGVFNTQEWTGDVRVGGKWAAAGIGGGQPYRLEGEFTAVEKPSRLAHTWNAVGSPAGPALLSYEIIPNKDGVELRLVHSGIMNPEILEKTRVGWETSLARLQEIINVEVV